MNPEVIILAGLYDFAVDLVVAELSAIGTSYVRLNREQLSDYQLCLDPISSVLTIRSNSVDFVVTSDHLKAVWFRQPVFLRNTPSEALSLSEQLSRSQWSAFQRALTVFDEAAWMNHPQATYLAECKPYQLMIARRCGFSVPKTLAGNDAGQFRAKFLDAVVIKSLDTVLLREGDNCLFTYTTISSSDALTEANTSAAPLFVQQLLDHKTDLRVTVVGDRIFAVKILVHGAGIEGDWRVASRDSLTYVDVSLNPRTEAACIDLARQLHLPFAAIDLVETPNGVFFIEVNPTGEWGWLNTSERRIDSAIANWLSRPVTHRNSPHA